MTRPGGAIQAFDRQGRLIGGVFNQKRGIEYRALVTEDGANRIAGIEVSLVSPEPAGFAINDVTLARIKELNRRQTQGIKAPTPKAKAPSLRRLGADAAGGEAAPDLKAPRLRGPVK